ncbi:hypothetical protein ACSBR1_023530 [Camellia fascicularis]
MASLQTSFCSVIKPTSLTRARPSLEFRAQSCRDEGRSSNIVDANLRVLRERIEEVRMKERLERCCTSENGWNYAPCYESKTKSSSESSHFFELFGLFTVNFGLTIVTATLCLCLVSLLVHTIQ